ncbi:hypothetical protein DD237_005495 [Peronospora effusa]|uniref:AAA+ ATPase domain-containing protein n=1 Tax=Peronospora effusa TaxID=542832 RepID=A0A425C8I0_9STRA|nr:hypothetical protein DD237_005495 [Peronospora effusa]
MATICINKVVGSIDGAVATAQDERCILYTCVSISSHKYVQVSSTSSVAFAQLRRQEDGSALSFGLLEALDESNGPQMTLQVTTDVEQDTNHTEIKCACKCGVIASVRVAFLDRTRPPSAVLRGLQRIAAKLLDGVVVWSERRSSVSWLNCRDYIKFVDIEWTSTGSGCCKQLGTILSVSNVKLTFVGDDRSQVMCHSAANFEAVDTYTRQIASELGGVEKYARSLLQTILQCLEPQKGAIAVRRNIGAMICGLPGIGKTVLAREICKCLGVTTIFLNAADVYQTYVGQSEKKLVKIFESAVLQSPSILVIDGIEAIAGSRRALADSQSVLEIGVLDALLSSLERIKSSSHRVFVLSTTTRPGDIDAAVLSNDRLDQVVSIEPPTQIERLAILRIITRTWQGDELDERFLNQVSESTGGFVGADLLSLCQKALQVCLNEAAIKKEGSAMVCPRHFEQALAVTYPSVLQAHHVMQKRQEPVSSFIHRNSKNTLLGAFSGVFGMSDAIQTLRVSLIEPLEDCTRFLRFGTTPPKGILLTGPPGSGKTHLANAVAEHVRRCGLASFVSVQCSDLLTKIVGDTEKALRELFATARNATPCVLYFDQIESIAPVRGFDTSTEQTFDRMLSMLLVEMDGFSTSRTKLQQSLVSDEARMAFLKQHVVILASTTNKELLDPAILRPGRFDVHIHVGYPDEDARCAFILQALEKVPVDYSSDAALDSREALARYVAKHTSGLSAGDLSAIVREAVMASMREDLDSTSVEIKYLLQTLEKATKSSTTAPSSSTPTPHLGALTHDRNRYKKNPPDFYALGQQYAKFKQYLYNVDDFNCRASLSWDDPFAVRELTKTLLLHDFGLQWDIPINRLCPPLPNRLNYLHWIEDLLSQAPGSRLTTQEQEQKAPALDKEVVSGIDVGTGANCIYALLGATMNKWKFIATEIDAESYACAKENVARNHLETLITVKRTQTNKLLLEPLQDEPLERKFHFVMCNPPFFDDMDEADTNPASSCMGSANEMVFPGGEVAFIGNMIVESVDLQNRVLWFTSMIGKKASLRKLLALLRKNQVRNTRTTEFFQGRTKRWGIAWTFSENVMDDPSYWVSEKKPIVDRKFASRCHDKVKFVNSYIVAIPCAGIITDCTFLLDIAAGKGCATIEEVLLRIREFVETNEELKLSEDTTNYKHKEEAEEEEDYQERKMYRLEQHKPDPQASGNNRTKVHSAGRVEIFTMKDNEGGSEVLIVFEEGDRAAFWTIANMLQAAIVRTGRQWRRKLQRQKQEQ